MRLWEWGGGGGGGGGGGLAGIAFVQYQSQEKKISICFQLASSRFGLDIEESSEYGGLGDHVVSRSRSPILHAEESVVVVMTMTVVRRRYVPRLVASILAIER